MPRSNLLTLARAAAAIVLATPVAHADVFYVTDSAADAITRINQGGVTTSFPASPTGLSDPQEVVFDAAGNAYVADKALGKVMLVPAGGGTLTQVGNDVPGVTSLAFSPSGVLHVASATDDTVRKLDGATFEILDTLPAAAIPRSIAFDSNGDLYVADNGDHKIYKIDPAGVRTVYSNAVTSPFAVKFDTAGKLHVTDTEEGGRIAVFNGNGNNARPIANADNLGAIRGLAFDAANTAHYLTAGGELRRISGSGTVLVAGNLGIIQLLTARTAGITAVAYKGLLVPSADAVAIGTVGSPAIGNGQVAFKSVLAPSLTVTAANALALFRSSLTGDLELLARKSFPAPGMTGAVLNSFADPVLNNSGRVAFFGTLRAGVGNVTAADAVAVFSDYDGGALRPVLRRGQTNLGNGLDAAVKLTAFRSLVLPDDSGPAVLATIAGPGVLATNNLGLWSLDSLGNLSLVLRSGTTLTVGGRSRSLAALTPFKGTPLSLGQARHFGGDQTFVFTAKFTDGFSAILRVKPDSAPEVLVEKGSGVGVAIPSAKLATLGSAAMAGDATFGFRGVLAPLLGQVTAATAPVILFRVTENEKVARAGDAAPDVTGGIFAQLSDPVVSTSGGVAFFAKLKAGLGNVTTATAAGLWQDLGTGVANAARQGDAAPGVPKATRFTAFKQFVLPQTGGVVFTAIIAGEGITTANNLGLWANDGAGANELLLRKGDRLLIGGKMKTVTGFKIFTAAPFVAGQSRHFDEGGTITGHVSCAGGTQAVLVIRRP